MTIRLSKSEDIDTIMQVLDSARNIMRQNGNMNQWTNGYPTRNIIIEDINKGNNYSVFDNNKIISVFTFIKGPDPTYNHIFQGNWLDTEKDYFVLHRIGKLTCCNNVLKEIFDYCFQFTDNIKIDTHKDNHIMQHLLEKYGFTYCGIIYLLNGDERKAYQKILQ